MTNAPVQWMAQYPTSSTSVYNHNIKITQLQNGNILVSAATASTNGVAGTVAGTDIVCRMYDPHGYPIGTEFLLNHSSQGSSEQDHSVTALGDGFAVTYNIIEGNNTSIVSDIYDEFGLYLYNKIIISDFDNNSPYYSLASAPSQGTSFLSEYKTIITYYKGDVFSSEVFGKIFNPVNNTLSGEFSIFGTGIQASEVKVATLAYDTFVVTARIFDQSSPSDTYLIYRFFNDNGTPISGNYLADGSYGFNFYDSSPSIAALSNGKFVISWVNVDNFDTDVLFLIVSSDGTWIYQGTAGTDSLESMNTKPEVTGLIDGSFIITYKEETTSSTVVEHFSEAGVSLGKSSIPGNALSMSMVTLADGRFAVAYEDAATNQPYLEIFDTRDAPNGFPVYSPGAQIGTVGNDIFVVNGFSQYVDGWDGNDEITYNDAAIALEIMGGVGNDRIIVNSLTVDYDRYDGGVGNDTIDFGTSAGGGIIFDLENQTASSGSSSEEINGFENLVGSLSIDQIYGTSFANILEGKRGNDVIDGRGGTDSAQYSYGGASANTGVGTVFGAIWGGTAADFQFRGDNGGGLGTGTDTLRNIETIQFVNTSSGNTTTTLDTSVITRYFNNPQLGIAQFGSTAATGGWTNNTTALRRMGDVNGDGFDDIIGFGANGTLVSLGNGAGGFAAPILGINSFGYAAAGGGWGSNNVYLRHVADVNGDGRDDIIGFGSAGTYVSLGQTNGTFGNLILGINSFGANVSAGGWVNDNVYARVMGDVNGDGRADIVGFGSGATYVALGQANGTFANPIIGIQSYGTAVSAGGWVGQNLYARRVADVNGDGRADIVAFGASKIFVSIGNANGTFQNPTVAGTDFTVSSGWLNDTYFHRELADLNNDGLMDIVGFGSNATYGALSVAMPGSVAFTAPALMTGQFNLPGISNDTTPRMMTNIDNDGRADIISFSANGAYGATNTTDYFVIA